MDKLKNATNFLKNKLKKDELEAKLDEAVSEQNWQASTQLLHQIANASYNFENQQKIIEFVWNKIKHKSWKKVLKTLHLVDFLLKYGPTSVIENFKQNVYEFRKLDDYTAKSGGNDQGQSVRKQAKAILLLVTDDQLLNDERAKAKQIKDRMANVIGSGAYFGGFNNDMKNNTSSTSSNNKGSNYSSISSESYKFGPSSSGAGMSFGQSVMRQLQEKKKNPVQPEAERAPPSKLNINAMMEKPEKKPEQQKKSFNSLSMKLVKPPQKKPVGPSKTSEPSVKPVQKPPQKTQGNANILDLDFNSLSVEDKSVKQPVSNNLLINQEPQATFPPSEPAAKPSNKASELPQTFEAFNFQQPQNQFQKPPPMNINNQQNMSQQSNFNFLGNSSPVQPPTISLNEPVVLNLESKKAEPQKKDMGSLIDFSNFRQELGQIKPQTKKEPIASNWNW